MEAAVKLFMEQGYQKTSIARIETEAGLAPRAGAFYRHFESKEALAQAVARAYVSETPENFGLEKLSDFGDTRAELIAIALKYEEAMAQFQRSKDEPKLRVRAGQMLGRCFYAEEWFTDAVAEFEESLQAIDATERDRELMIKYDLMLALIGAARDEDSIDLAKQAKQICSEIARRDITYRDIRAKRKEVDALIKSLSGEG